MARSGSLKMDGPYPAPVGPHLIVNNEDVPEQNGNTSIQDGAIHTENRDGSVTIDLNPSASDLLDDDAKDTSFTANLANKMSDGELSTIASELLEGLQRDEESRRNWLSTRAQGISLLGLELEKPRSDTGNASAPLEGMSTVRHPLLLEATVTFQATARAELLPSTGPVKVRDDSPSGPPKPLPTEQGNDPDNPTPTTPPTESTDDLAQALEKDFNHYLTVTAPEYVPDTDRMLFYVGFGGDGFKKVYNCPRRRRPVSESVDAENLVVSNAATDMEDCGRVTHIINMRKSVLRRMQLLGEYRDIDLAPPTGSQKTEVDKKKESISGHTSTNQRPEDRDYTICEIYCELDLPEYAPKRFKDKSLPLPYRVTIERESRQILDIRRNWEEKDEQCCAKQYFVQFPFIRGLGFYGLGYIHLLGNTTIALTAAWRLQLDNGMFANFPGFLYAKGIGRQLSNQFRVPPGGGVGLDLGSQQDIRSAVMPLPYKETGPSFSAFSTHVEEVGHRLAASSNINVGEGKQDAPVGTTLALIEQATKVIDSAHKRLHASQAKEFMLLKERFKEDPEAFWRFNKSPAMQWEKKQFLDALNNHNIVPVADPNNPTSLHRMAKAMAVKELQKASPELYDPVKVDLKISRMADLGLEDVMREIPATPPPDPRMVAIQQKAASSEQQNQIQLQEVMIKHQDSQAEIADKQAERASRERIEAMKIQEAQIKLRNEQIIHQHDMMSKRNEMAMDAASKQQDMQHDQMGHTLNMYQEAHKHQAQMKRDDEAHRLKMEHDKQTSESDVLQSHLAGHQKLKHEEAANEQKLEHAKELGKAKVEVAKKMPKPAKPATTKKPKKD